MGRFGNYVSAAAGLVILAGAFTVIGPYVNQGQADPPVKNVNVVNTPLPTTVQSGNINATVTGNVTGLRQSRAKANDNK